MFVAPAVAWEISEPPRIPRGTSCSAPGFTSFMQALPRSSSPWSGDGKIVIEPLRPPGADAVVERLRALVVRRGLPRERDGPVRAGRLGACGDQRLADAAGPRPARVRRDEEVVHDADARRAGRRPRPEALANPTASPFGARAM